MPSPPLGPLYCAIRPQTGTRANLLSNGNTACQIAPPLREAYRALPDVAELELVETLAGLRPGTPDNAPLVGPGALDGLVLATGHYRNGILLTPISAEAVAALLAQDPLPPEAQVAHPGRFAGETAPGLVAAPTTEEAPR